MKKSMIILLGICVLLLASCGDQTTVRPSSSLGSEEQETIQSQEPETPDPSINGQCDTAEKEDRQLPQSAEGVTDVPKPSASTPQTVPEGKKTSGQTDGAATEKPVTSPVNSPRPSQGTASAPTPTPVKSARPEAAPSAKPIETFKPTPTPKPSANTTKTAYDYPFDIGKIKSDMIARGKALGFKHQTNYEDGRAITPDNSSWELTVTASKDFQGKQLKNALMEYVDMFQNIGAYGGEMEYFTIYAQKVSGGYKFYVLH